MFFGQLGMIEGTKVRETKASVSLREACGSPASESLGVAEMQLPFYLCRSLLSRFLDDFLRANSRSNVGIFF